MIFIIISAPLSFTYFDEDVLVLKNNVRSNENETVGLHGLNGSGVIITVADTGIDLDHSCFRNSSNEIGEPGLQHRKIIYLNDTLDDWDNQGHQQFRTGRDARIQVCPDNKPSGNQQEATDRHPPIGCSPCIWNPGTIHYFPPPSCS